MKPITILMGMSSSGKDAIANYLSEHYNYNKAISFTTRPPRYNEKHKVDYYFTNKNIFTDMILHKELIEYRSYNTLVDNISDIWYYGLHKEINNIDFSKQNILILDYQGCLNALQYFGIDKCEVIYIDVPDNIRKERAEQRGSFDIIEWNRRCESDKKDFKWNKIKGVVNKKFFNVDKTIDEICKEIIEWNLRKKN